MDACSQKKLRSRKLAALRRLIQQRKTGSAPSSNAQWQKRRCQAGLTCDALVRDCQKEAERQKVLIKKAELTQGRLMFAVEAFRALRDDDHFLTLLRAEGRDTPPTCLGQSLDAGAAE